ncbi:hypothetical protein GCM10027088_09140 [Nocardia goodfellowii]
MAQPGGLDPDQQFTGAGFGEVELADGDRGRLGERHGGRDPLQNRTTNLHSPDATADHGLRHSGVEKHVPRPLISGTVTVLLSAALYRAQGRDRHDCKE